MISGRPPWLFGPVSAPASERTGYRYLAILSCSAMSILCVDVYAPPIELLFFSASSLCYHQPSSYTLIQHSLLSPHGLPCDNAEHRARMYVQSIASGPPS